MPLEYHLIKKYLSYVLVNVWLHFGWWGHQPIGKNHLYVLKKTMYKVRDDFCCSL